MKITKKLVKETISHYKKERNDAFNNVKRSFFELQKNVHSFIELEDKIFSDIEKNEDEVNDNIDYGEIVYSFTRRTKGIMDMPLFFAMECISDYEKDLNVKN